MLIKTEFLINFKILVVLSVFDLRRQLFTNFPIFVIGLFLWMFRLAFTVQKFTLNLTLIFLRAATETLTIAKASFLANQLVCLGVRTLVAANVAPLSIV